MGIPERNNRKSTGQRIDKTFKFSWASVKITRVIFLIIRHVSVVITFVGRGGWLAVCVRYTGM